MTLLEQYAAKGVQLVINAQDLQAMVDEYITDKVARATNGNMLTQSQAAEQLGVSRSTLLRWRKDGRLQAVEVGNTVRFEQSAIEQLKKQNTNILQQCTTLQTRFAI